MHLKKHQGGCEIRHQGTAYAWENDGDVTEVPDELAMELVPLGGFEVVQQSKKDEREAEQEAADHPHKPDVAGGPEGQEVIGLVSDTATEVRDLATTVPETADAPPPPDVDPDSSDPVKPGRRRARRTDED